MIPYQHLPTMNFVVDDDDLPEDDVILYSVLYSSVTLVFAMAVLSKFLTNELRFGLRSILSLVVLFLGEPLCQFFIKGPGGVAGFAIGCLLVYSVLPASHLPVGNKTVLITGNAYCQFVRSTKFFLNGFIKTYQPILMSVSVFNLKLLKC